MCFDFYNTGGWLFDVSLESCLAKTCSSCITGDEPQCASKEACEAHFSCNNPSGCVQPLSTGESSGYTPPCRYAPPDQCSTAYAKAPCNLVGSLGTSFHWEDSLTYPTNEECLGAFQLCNDGTVPDGSHRDSTRRPAAYSLKNKTECEACGGHMESWWNWTQSRWINKNVIVNLSWLENVVTPAVWVANILLFMFMIRDLDLVQEPLIG